MQAGQKYGMQTMNQALYRAVMDRKIARNEAMRMSSDTIELEQMFGEKSAQRKYQFKK
jgi:Tfp pilus assembly pilus retraction ATPase PilT